MVITHAQRSSYKHELLFKTLLYFLKICIILIHTRQDYLKGKRECKEDMEEREMRREKKERREPGKREREERVCNDFAYQ